MMKLSEMIAQAINANICVSRSLPARAQTLERHIQAGRSESVAKGKATTVELFVLPFQPCSKDERRSPTHYQRYCQDNAARAV